MNTETHKKGMLIAVATAGVISGIAGGFFAAHMMMGDMTSMKEHDTKAMQGMEGMQGMSPAPSAVVAVPAVMRQLIGVRSAPVGYAPLEQEIRTVGSVDYDERGHSRVTLKVSGWVREVFVNSVGRSVRKGEPLFTLYSPDLLVTQEEYLLALKANAQLGASPLADAKEHTAALVASARERLRLWDITDAQMAALEQRGTPEPVMTVYAPSNGSVLKRDALPGGFVEPGATLYELADLSTVWVYADIYESEVAAVKLNHSASVEFAAYPGETLRATVTYIQPSLNEAARTVRVRLALPNPGRKLKPGMFGTVTVHTDSAKTLVVLKEAVLDTGLRQVVFLDKGEGVYQPMPVKLGRRSQDLVEVLEGLTEGDRVVTSAAFLLDAESKLASTSTMQEMMGRIGMGDMQMRGTYEQKMDDRDMKGMK